MSLVNVPACSRASMTVQKVFYESLPETKVDIVSIHTVWSRMSCTGTSTKGTRCTCRKELLEHHLFRSTSENAADDICHNNFDPQLAIGGRGSYFATWAIKYHLYKILRGHDRVRPMFLAKVLVGMETYSDVFITFDSCQTFRNFLIRLRLNQQRSAPAGCNQVLNFNA
ncbi:protein mono-ADP-ribosyltransferase TIPARP-like isoform X2 [Nerophis ophidion]|uniref:protein mono-ADP-ribosyltransferase TIPARP-like isoform X2 n=1 Tax=Nerophis ophidion TaxID=159077 RepID=UPI002AE08ABF|nr:protein mono-ADP-ribosyltransferase TIPARP-like isoform X2 [Nerophis ophidion]